MREINPLLLYSISLQEEKTNYQNFLKQMKEDTSLTNYEKTIIENYHIEIRFGLNIFNEPLENYSNNFLKYMVKRFRIPDFISAFKCWELNENEIGILYSEIRKQQNNRTLYHYLMEDSYYLEEDCVFRSLLQGRQHTGNNVIKLWKQYVK